MSSVRFRHSPGDWSIGERTQVVATAADGVRRLVCDVAPAIADAFDPAAWDQAEADAQLLVHAPLLAAQLDRVLTRLSASPLSHPDRRRLVREITTLLRAVTLPVSAIRTCA